MSERRDVILIFGQTGSGKTTWLKEELARRPRVLLLDADFEELPVAYFDGIPALVYYLQGRNCFGTLVPFRASCTPQPWDYETGFETALALKNVDLVLEEADRFDVEHLDAYAEVIVRGRHHGVGLLAASLHPFAISKEVRRQATRVISFRQTDPEDLRWISFLVGDAAWDLPDYPAHEFLDWRADGELKIRQKHALGPRT